MTHTAFKGIRRFPFLVLLLAWACTTKPLKPHSENPRPETPEVVGVQVSALPSRTMYFLDQTLDLTGLVLEVACSDGANKTVSDIPLSDVSGFDSSVPGKNRRIEVKYAGHSASFSITVLPITVEGTKMTGIRGDLSGFSDLVIPEGITSIAENALFGVRGIVSVSVPRTVSSIGKYAFAQCLDLKTADLSGSRIEVISPSLFEASASLEEVRLPDGLKEIAGSAFLGTAAMKEIRLPEGLETIGNTAFTHSGLVSIRLPNSITSMRRSFYSCSDLRTVTVYGSGPEQSGEGIMEGECFSRCPQIEAFEIPLGISKCGISVLGACRLKELVLHENITALDFNAFSNTGTLESVIIRNTSGVIPMQSSLPQEISSIHVPESLLPAYMSDPEWGRYGCFVTD